MYIYIYIIPVTPYKNTVLAATVPILQITKVLRTCPK